ncbi:hypothetical protein LAD54_10340 [Klebsiella pneumoniae]|uniref:hypothetical protein n=1 Tax=Klebsiella pneumoniae complex TaxID=3390273 RepID=UPI000D742A78|nr:MULTISPECIES: hypothetical protein [Klebsiella]MCX9939047.1 hypothetical protein [Klebsiella pneumoniae]MCY0259833.1 hypothetical protein [Klebsiella pneumoniae]PXH33312.1 hypothetical protein DMR13_13000 [Klebsiella variicola]SXD75589.1 Uncharacterised protein [Klebsiella variicola]HCT8728671.1 hypothetical protein [Klebsiella pneumoniae]
MSFKITKQISRLVSYPEFGASDANERVSAELTYEAKNVIGLDINNACQVQFSVAVNSSQNAGSFIYGFIYSGAGNPLTEAEAALEAELAQ